MSIQLNTLCVAISGRKRMKEVGDFTVAVEGTK